ncbi:hypothetical protein GGR58DRAFT_515031 [Xylaria digitata]|nr:hypothetical protein GGR58DRAFT_515031 [Xylaria digitata]
MAFKLVLPQCEQIPTCVNHPPEWKKPLRIQVMGLNKDLDNLFDDGIKCPRPRAPYLAPWRLELPFSEGSQLERHVDRATEFIEPGLRFVQMAFRLLYGRDPDPRNPSDIVSRHQYDIWRGATADRVLLPEPILEGYAITFDHLLGPDDEGDPETLMLNIVDPNDPPEADLITIDKSPYTSGHEPVLLLIPRCCQVRKGTTDRRRINRGIREANLPEEVRMKRLEEESRAYEEKLLRKSKAQTSSDVA